jgi:plasmid stabilization system protein ParE
MKLIIFDEAQDEIDEIVAWYARRDPVVAQRLMDLFTNAVERIAQKPNQFPLLEMRRNPGDIRRVRLKGFPAYIGYQVLEDEIHVFAVAHTARKPGYWKSRLRRKRDQR